MTSREIILSGLCRDLVQMRYLSTNIALLQKARFAFQPLSCFCTFLESNNFIDLSARSIRVMISCA